MIRGLVISALDRLTSVAVGVALTWLATALHLVVDPSSEAGLKVLAAGILAAVYDLGARALAKRWTFLAPFLGVKTPASGTGA